MKRIGYIAGWIGVGLFCVISLTFGAVGAWENGGPFARLAGVLALPAIFGALGMVAWADSGLPPPRPSRAVRRQLRQERDRIALAAEIERMEREAGLR
jgi:hypothetical protein